MDTEDLLRMKVSSDYEIVPYADCDVFILRVPGGWIYNWHGDSDIFVQEPKDSQQTKMLKQFLIRKELHESYGKILTAKQDLIQDLESKLRDSGLECSKLRRKVETLENIVINKGGD